MTTLFTATLDLARMLTSVREGTATAVATTSITDSNSNFVNGLFQGGTLWLHDSTPTTKLVDATGGDKIIFATGTAPSSSVRYSLAGKDYPRDILRQSINLTIKEMYPQVAENTATVSVAGQIEYSLPTGVTDLVRVEVEYYLDSTSQRSYYIHHEWKEIGSKLRFLGGIPNETGRYIRLTYRVYPSDLTADSDTLPALLDMELLKWKAACHALRWGLEQYGQDPAKRVAERLNEAQAEAARRGGNKKIVTKSTILGGW